MSAVQQSEPSKIIPNPCGALFGVAIKSDGTFENVGIGSFGTDVADDLANRLIELAGAIKASAHKRLSSC